MAGELRLPAGANVLLTLFAAAYLPEHPNKSLHELPYDEQPYWNVERARIGDSREVAVENVMNGKLAVSQKLLADGTRQEMKFEIPLNASSWTDARIVAAAHTNPVFVIVGGKPIRASRRSAEWC